MISVDVEIAVMPKPIQNRNKKRPPDKIKQPYRNPAIPK